MGSVITGLLNFFVSFAIMASIYAIFSIGLNVHWGYTGLLNFGIAGFFDTLVFSSRFGFCKPHPSIFRKGLHGLATAPEETLFIGDRLDVDVAGAQKVGMRGILKRHPYREEEMSGVVPDGIIDRLEEILTLL